MYLLLYILWVALNGKVTVEICLLGAFVVGAVGLITYGLFRYSPRVELRIYKKVPILFAFGVILVKEIIKSNFAVLHFIVSKKAAIEPAIMSFEVDLKTDLARFLLANSITLTPGTITVLANGNRFTVHSLDSRMLDGLDDSTIVRLLRKMEA